MTTRDLIERAYQDLNILDAGTTLGADDANYGLVRLNDWIDQLKLESLFIYSIVRSTWTIVSGTASYSVGSGGAVNIPRPVSANAIQNIGFVDASVSPSLERTVGAPLTEQAYQAVAQKTLQATYPSQWYYTPTYPLGALKPFPIPNISTLTGVIYAPAPVDELGLTDTLALPPGYRRFLRAGLAIEIASGNERAAIPPTVTMAYQEARSAIKAANVRMRDLSLDPAVLTDGRGLGYDIQTDS